MTHGGSHTEQFGLPEYRREEFDEQALEDAIRDTRRRELAELMQLNA